MFKFYYKIFISLLSDYTEEWIWVCSSMCSVLSEELSADEFGCNKEEVGYCWPKYDVDLDKFESTFNALVSIVGTVLPPISINN